MQDSDKKSPEAAEHVTANEDSAIAKRRKLIGRVLMGSPAVLLMTAMPQRAKAASIQGSGPTGKS